MSKPLPCRKRRAARQSPTLNLSFKQARLRQSTQVEHSVSLVLNLQSRDDGVNPHTVENSLRKAYTAFTTRTATAEMAKRSQPALSGFMLLDKITPIEGGLPLFAGKELVGAVGISGAPGGEKDAACAQVGIDKIAKALGN